MSSWPTEPLKELAEVRLGRQRSPKNHSGSQMRPYLRAANVGWQGLILEDVKEMNFTDAEMLTYRLRPGDLLLSEASGSAGEVGKPALWNDEIDECAFQNTLLRVRSYSMEPRFLLHYFRFMALSGRFVEQSRGVGIHHLGRERLARWMTPHPPMAEQRRIVAILEEHLSSLHAAGDYLTASALRIRRLRDVTVRRALTGGEDPSPRWQPHLPAAGTHDGSLAPLPLGWRWARLGDIADIVGGVTKDTQKQSDATLPQIPNLRVANVQRGRLDLTNVAMNRVPPAKAVALTLRPGDVLLNEGGDRDKLARGWVWEGQIEACIHQNHVFRARLKDDRLDPYFLAWTTNSFGGRWAERNGKQSVNLASISLSKIRQMPVIVPPPGVAARVAARLADDVAALDRIDSDIRTAQSRQALLLKSLLSAAFAGRLVGRSSDSELVEELADQEAS